MKQIGIFDRIAMLEAQTARLAQIVAAQVDALQSLTDQITALQTALDAPRAVAIMPTPNAVPMSFALRSMMQISADVAASSNLTVADIRGRRRERAFAWPRQDAMRRMHEAGHSSVDIGFFLKRDHTTILHGVRAARARMVAN